MRSSSHRHVNKQRSIGIANEDREGRNTTTCSVMLILYFIELEYKCPVYDDSNLVRTLDSFASISNVACAHNAFRRGQVDWTVG